MFITKVYSICFQVTNNVFSYLLPSIHAHYVFVRHLDLDCVVFQMIGRTEKSVHASMCSMRKESLKKMELVLNSDRERVKQLNFIPIN